MVENTQPAWSCVEVSRPDDESPALMATKALTNSQTMASCHPNGESGMSQCPDQHEAKKFFKEHREGGTLSLVLTRHASEEFSKDDMDIQDCMNVLRAGAWDPPEWENGSWRYRVRTQKMTVVMAIDFQDAEFTIVTGWRNS